MRKFIPFFVLIVLISCNDNIEEPIDSILFGDWNGYQTISLLDSFPNDTLTNVYSVAFAYANGVSIFYDGILKGRLAENTSDPDTDFYISDFYIDTWELLDPDIIRLADVYYTIHSITEKELVLRRVVNANQTEILKLKKE